MKEDMSQQNPLVGVIMGSRSDWETMSQATEILNELQIPFEAQVVSAHRTPKWMFEYAETAESRGLKCIVCRCRRRGASTRHGGLMHDPASAGSTGAKSRAERTRLVAVDRANAGRNPSRNAGNWYGWSEKRGVASR